MRELLFAPWTATNLESNSLFAMIYGAFIGGVDNPNRARSIEETRHAIKVLEAFEAISDVKNEGTDQEARSLKEQGGSVILPQAAHALLSRCVTDWASTAPFAAAKLVMKVKDFVDSAPIARAVSNQE